MRSLLIRVVFLLCLCKTVVPAFPQRPPGPASPIVSANEKSARLALLEKSSVFSIALSANASAPRPAKLAARMFSANGALLAENSVPVELNPQPRRFEVSLKWIPGVGLDEVSSVRLSYAVQFDGEPAPALSGILSPYKLIPD